jgi:TonB-dependent starch-binding outer membrane protein SusC
MKRKILPVFKRGILSFLLASAISVGMFAQPVKITGTVKDVSNVPLVGVTVVEKGTTNGTMTDADGHFTLTLPDKHILQVSMIGFKMQEIEVNGTAPIEVVLAEELTAIDEVVVVGYGTVKRGDITTSVSTVSTKDLQERPMISAATAIQGKAAGVTVIQPNGEPGAAMVVRIRGNTSINASNDPLYVVDGVPVTDINFLSPNDIESMQILKDASSAAIYGSRGANGVVLIVTKSGAKGKSKINFNTSLGFTEVVKTMTSLNTAQYKELMDENGAATIPDGLTDKTNWFDETYRRGSAQNYQLSFNGSSDKVNYFFSGGYIKEVGVIQVAYYQRFNLRANVDAQIKKWLKIGVNLAYSDYSNNGIISGTGSNRAGVILSVINTPTYAPIWDPDHPDQYYNNFYGAQVTTPVENMSRTADDNSLNNHLIGTFNAEATILPSLIFRSSISLDRLYKNSTTFLDPVKTSYGRSQYGTASDNRELGTVYVFDNYLTYDKKFGEHSLSVMGGTSWTQSYWSQTYLGASHFLDAGVKTLNAGNKIEQWSGTTASDWAIMSVISRLNYNYKSKYIFTANFRADGSSKLAPGHKWGYFPAFSAAWRLSAEPFMQNVRAITDLKLRLGWGQAGNQSGIGDYQYRGLYDYQRINWWETGQSNALPVLVPKTMDNVDLTWETTTTSNIGVDVSLLKGRLSLAVDAYYKYTTNLLMDVTLPSSSHIANLVRNEGEMSNKGLEFTVDSRNIERALTWTTNFNISFNRNKIEKFTLQKVFYYGQTSEATSEYIVRMVPGKPISQFYGYISDGVDPETGNLIYRDINKDGKVNLSDKTYIGDPNPDFIYGLTNTFTYRGFSLNIFLQGTQGNDIYNSSRMETEGMYDAKNQSTRVLDRWRRPGQVTYMPKATSTKDNLSASTRFVEDGSYLRIKTLTLSYDVSSTLLKKWGISRVQPYFTAQNLLTFTNYKGFDPEVNQFANDPDLQAVVQGVDWGTYPQSKSYVFGLNVEF